MQPKDFQLITLIKNKVWTKIFGDVPQDWTLRNCKTIEDEINKVTELSIDAKTIQRFSLLTINDEIDQKTSKDMLAMFLAGQKAKNKQIDKSVYLNMLTNLPDDESPFSVYVGKYRLFRINEVSKSNYSSATIEIYKNRDTEINTDMGEVFRGKVSCKNTNLFFVFENSHETFLITSTVGITKNKSRLHYLPSILSAVGSKITLPYACATLLVKMEDKPIEEERINAYFDYVNTESSIKIDKHLIDITDTQNLIENLMNINPPETPGAIRYVIGNWVVYTKSLDDTGIYKSKLKIVSSNNLEYWGTKVSYPKGEVKVIGEDVYIYFYGRKNALLNANLQYEDGDKIDEILMGFTTISAESRKPVLGFALLVRETKINFEDIPIRFIPKDDPEYKELESLNVVSRLKLE